jgi:outer membrane protein assembly factor BamB
MPRLLPLCALAVLLAACHPSSPALPAAEIDGKPKPFDWPQWQGPNRTSVSEETGLLKEWPKNGLPLAWKVKDLGGGYSAPSIAAGRIFGMGYRGGDEVVWALDERDGKELWSSRIAAASKSIGSPGGEGSRCTPTVDGDLLYALGAAGEMACLKVADGKVLWHKSLPGDFGGRHMARWGYCESPLVDGDKLICTPGGKDATVAALNKKTGEVIWKASVSDGNGAGYASPIAIKTAGHKQYVHFLEGGLAGIDAATGKVLWRSGKGANRVANCTTPVYSDGCVFVASAYGAGGALVKLSQDEQGGVKAEEVYATRKMENHHGGLILHDGYLYGANGGNGGGNLICLDFKTGKVMWDERDKPGRSGVTKGSVVMADGRIYYRQEDGTMILFEPSPKAYVERGRFAQPDRSRASAWPHPVIANGKLYLRDQDVLLCYDVKAK